MVDSIVYWLGLLLMGGFIGWVAGLMVKGNGTWVIGYPVVGILGALLGGALFRILGQSTYNPIGGFFTALVGSVLLMLLIRHIKHLRVKKIRVTRSR